MLCYSATYVYTTIYLCYFTYIITFYVAEAQKRRFKIEYINSYICYIYIMLYVIFICALLLLHGWAVAMAEKKRSESL